MLKDLTREILGTWSKRQDASHVARVVVML